MWRVQTITTSALCCNVSSGSRLHISEEAKDLVLDATVLAQVGGVKLWHLDIGSPLGNMPNEPASSLQKGGSSNLLVAEVSVDGLNLLDGPALGCKVGSAGVDFSICSCLARGVLGISSSITIIVSFLQETALRRHQLWHRQYP